MYMCHGMGNNQVRMSKAPIEAKQNETKQNRTKQTKQNKQINEKDSSIFICNFLSIF